MSEDKLKALASSDSPNAGSSHKALLTAIEAQLALLQESEHHHESSDELHDELR